jgi:hypothetical protein
MITLVLSFSLDAVINRALSPLGTYHSSSPYVFEMQSMYQDNWYSYPINDDTKGMNSGLGTHNVKNKGRTKYSKVLKSLFSLSGYS